MHARVGECWEMSRGYVYLELRRTLRYGVGGCWEMSRGYVYLELRRTLRYGDNATTPGIYIEKSRQLYLAPARQ